MEHIMSGVVRDTTQSITTQRNLSAAHRRSGLPVPVLIIYTLHPGRRHPPITFVAHSDSSWPGPQQHARGETSAACPLASPPVGERVGVMDSCLSD